MGDRQFISDATKDKVKNFLKKQKTPVFKSTIVKEAGVDYNSLKIALEMLNVRINKDGRIRLR